MPYAHRGAGPRPGRGRERWRRGSQPRRPPGLPGRIEHAVDQRLGAAVERAAEHVPDAVKPRLRGWLHAGAVPVALVAGIVLVALSRGTAEVVASAIYAVTTVLLFTVSAVYHRGPWTGRTRTVLQRFDHANIFLIIAGSYTPFAVLLLAGGQRTTLLLVVWGGALRRRRSSRAVGWCAALAVRAGVRRPGLGGGVCSCRS